jgi:rhodanese-related sulfurtransferase
MKTKYWRLIVSLTFLFDLLLAAGCTQSITQTSSTSKTILPSTADIPIITTLDAYNLIRKNAGNPDFIILDVRTPDEFKSGHIADAINIDYYAPDFQTNIGELDKNKQYLVYCRTGIRAAAAVRLMTELGFKEVQNLAGGIVQWMQDVYPTVQ